ncbi:MAG: hypothetical protein FH751_02815 [Firmicutes bacterium]|nr:hypothetical protein [Bacillota bacterium]
MNIYFSDYFNVDKDTIKNYGAFDISLVADLPLFVDPFLLFNSTNKKYQQLHKDIIEYLSFLRDKSVGGKVNEGLLRSWYTFKEVKQNWFGFSVNGSSGSGLGMKFARALDENLNTIFDSFGEENITEDSHLEKLCLINVGVGKDNISDFTTNLIKEFLLEFTQEFAQKHIDESLLKEFRVEKVKFNYETETWMSKTFKLPCFKNDYVILTPTDLLTKDDTFISSIDMYNKIETIIDSIENVALRGQINNYLRKTLEEDMKKSERKKVYQDLVKDLPEIIDYYINYKESEKNEATSISNAKVEFSNNLYVNKYKELIELLVSKTNFFKIKPNSFEEALSRVQFLKNVIEDMDGYRIFYVDGEPIKREQDFQILYKLTWFTSESDINSEVNNGRGPVDFKASKGSADKTLVEFKLAKNTQLKRNLKNQVEVYKKANRDAKTIKVILYFTDKELEKVNRILNELDIAGEEAIILIDARKDKKSASEV